MSEKVRLGRLLFFFVFWQSVFFCRRRVSLHTHTWLHTQQETLCCFLLSADGASTFESFSHTNYILMCVKPGYMQYYWSFIARIALLLCILFSSPSSSLHSPIHPGRAALRPPRSKNYPSPLGSSTVATFNEVGVDEDLYSRQLLVHGKASQQSLLKSHVAIIGKG